METNALFETLLSYELPNAHDLVASDLESRKQIGILTYGRFLTQKSPEDMLQMAYEEVLDLACYLRTEIEKRKDTPPPTQQASQLCKRGEVTNIYPDTKTWKHFMLHILIPDFLKLKGFDYQFTMNELKAYMNTHSDIYVYRDSNKRMSSAITDLHHDGYVYHPSRYRWAATAKFLAEVVNK